MRYGKSLHLPEVLDEVVPVLVVVIVGVVAVVVVVKLTPPFENKYHKAKMTLTNLYAFHFYEWEWEFPVQMHQNDTSHV